MFILINKFKQISSKSLKVYPMTYPKCNDHNFHDRNQMLASQSAISMLLLWLKMVMFMIDCLKNIMNLTIMRI